MLAVRENPKIKLIVLPNRFQVGLTMEWSERISIDSEVLQGKPVVKGSRMAVEFIVDLLAQGRTTEDILANYPELTAADILACLGYAASLIRGEGVPPAPTSVATGDEPRRQNPNLGTPVMGDIRQVPTTRQLSIRGLFLV